MAIIKRELIGVCVEAVCRYSQTSLGPWRFILDMRS